MKKSIKCENCGAIMQTDTENELRFCPYCGYAMEMPEDIVGLAKFQMKHEENVRQQKVKEQKETDKHIMIGLAVFFGLVILTVAIIFISRGNTDAGLERTVAEVQQLIIEGNYDEALIRAQTIRVQKDGLFDERYSRWENQRKDLIKLIEQKKRVSGK